MRVPGVKKLRLASRWVRSRLRAKGVILGYHRIDQPDSDPFRLAVSPARFEEQMAVVRQAGEVLPLGEMANAAAEGRLPRAAIAITFDDGYLDNLDLNQVARFESELLAHMHGKHSDVMDWITNEDPKIKGEAADKLKAAIDGFAADFA